MKPFLLLALLLIPPFSRAELQFAGKEKTKYVIVVDPAATAPERNAANELAATLQQITGANFPIRTNTRAPARAILVGLGTAARRVLADVPFDTLGAEELVIK